MDVLILNNYVEPDGNVRELIRLAQQHGFAGVEVRRTNFEQVTALAESGELDVQVIWNGGVDLVQPDDAAREAALKQYEQQLAKTARFAPRIHNLSVGTILNPAVARTTVEEHGSAIATEGHWRRAVTGLQQLADVANRYGIVLAVEIHPLTLHDTAANAMKLAQQVARENVGVTLEPGNLAQYPGAESPEEAIDLLGDRLFHVHLKNLQFLRGSRACRISGLSEGDINLHRCLAHLAESGYNGPCTLESTHRGDRRWMLRHDAAYLRHLLETLQIPSSLTAVNAGYSAGGA